MPMLKRNYKQERKTAIARGETGVGSSSNDAVSHRARRKVEKKLGHKVPAGMDVDHKTTQKSGGSNGLSNLRLRKVSANRSAGGKAGNASKKGKKVL